MAWLAHVFGDSGGFTPLKVFGHEPAGWLTDKGSFAAICEPVPVSPKGKPLRDAAGKVLRFFATDIYEQALNPHYDYNHPGPGPGDCIVIGYRGGFWETATGDLLLPQDTRFWKSTRKQPFSLASPLRCLGGETATGSDADRLFVTHRGPSHYLVGPIPPTSPGSEERIQDLLARTPDTFLKNIHRLCVSRHAAVMPEEARKVFQVELPEELLLDLPYIKRLCPVGAFLRWFMGFSAEDVSMIHPPEGVDYRRRLGALIARMDTLSRALWSAMLAGDEQARREYADVVECQGDPGRAALLRVGLAKHRMRSLDAGWAN